MAIYAVGDLQGCYDAFRHLLDKLKFDPDEVFVVGDTIYDVECALHNGFKAIGIARKDGEKEMEQLKDAGASWVYNSLPTVLQLMTIAKLN